MGPVMVAQEAVQQCKSSCTLFLALASRPALAGPFMVAWHLTGHGPAPKLATASSTSLRPPPPAGTSQPCAPHTWASAAATASFAVPAAAAAPTGSPTPCGRPGTTGPKPARAPWGLTAAAQAPLQAGQPPEHARAALSSSSLPAPEPQTRRSSAPPSKPWAWSIPAQPPPPAQPSQLGLTLARDPHSDISLRALQVQQPGPAPCVRPPQPSLQLQVGPSGPAEACLGSGQVPATRWGCAVGLRGPAPPAHGWVASKSEPLQQRQDAGQWETSHAYLHPRLSVLA